MHPPYVAVVGPSEPDRPETTEAAREAGRLLAERGYVVVTGGLGGVMAAAARVPPRPAVRRSPSCRPPGERTRPRATPS